MKAFAAIETNSGSSENDLSPMTELVSRSTSRTGAKLKSTEHNFISVAINQPTSRIKEIAEAGEALIKSPSACMEGNLTNSLRNLCTLPPS